MVTVNQVAAFVIFCALSLSTQVHSDTELLAIVLRPDKLWQTEGKTKEPISTNEILEQHNQPPSPDDAAKMARYIVHYSTISPKQAGYIDRGTVAAWGSLSHISQQPQVAGFPLARIYSISDGPIHASSGIPYFYMTPNDPELRDIYKDPRVSLTVSLAQTPYCRMKGFDPEDPRCAQVALTGRFVILKNSSAVWQQAQEAMFSRHPVMKNWPASHHWVLCKLEIKRILVADNFGGNKYPTVEEYFKANPDTCSMDNPLLDLVFF